MRIIDNVNELLGDDLKAEVKAGSRLRIAASTFSIFAFETLKRELSQIKELEFIFTAPSFNTAKATDKPAPGPTAPVRQRSAALWLTRRDSLERLWSGSQPPAN